MNSNTIYIEIDAPDNRSKTTTPKRLLLKSLNTGDNIGSMGSKYPNNHRYIRLGNKTIGNPIPPILAKHITCGSAPFKI